MQQLRVTTQEGHAVRLCRLACVCFARSDRHSTVLVEPPRSMRPYSMLFDWLVDNPKNPSANRAGRL